MDKNPQSILKMLNEKNLISKKEMEQAASIFPKFCGKANLLTTKDIEKIKQDIGKEKIKELERLLNQIK